MINKIGNWVFGSFFRTIGRLLVFVLLGVIIANLVDFGTLIDNFRITDLFFEKVNAEQIVVPVIPRASEYYYGIPNWSSGWTISSDANFAQREVWSHNYMQEAWLQFSSTDFSTDIDYLEFSYTLNQPLEVVTNESGSTTTVPGQDYCNRWTWGAIDSNNQVIRWDCARVDQTDGYTITDSTAVSHTSIVDTLNVYAEIEYTNGNKPMCTIIGNSIICPTNHLTPYKLHIYTYFETTKNTHYNFSISRHVRGYFAQNQQQVIDTINNQTQQQQQQHEEMMDSNTTQAEDEASDFLGNFTVEDTGGLNAIITAPLSTIQSLLNNTCNKLVLPLPFVDKNIELPCLYPIYNDYFGAFFTIYQTIILGIISYRCIKSLFFDVKGFTNPEDDRIEVMDL